MPLLDHFHPPLRGRRHWHSFHHSWATVIAFELNSILPQDFFAEANVQFGIEIDVGTFEDKNGEAYSSWAPPSPVLTVPMALLTDVVEVQVFNQVGGPVLAGTLELISPANKD